jgi:hypothetical protein
MYFAAASGAIRKHNNDTEFEEEALAKRQLAG